MRIAFIALLLMTTLCGRLLAGDLSVTGQMGQVWNPAAEPSPVHLFGIENTTGTSEMLVGWQLSLRLTGAPGSTGTLQFNEASLPVDYLLEGRSMGLVPPLGAPSETIPFISDWDALMAGVAVPASGKNLLQVDFTASADASGLFNIELAPFESDTGSLWIPPPLFPLTSNDFLNAPAGGGPFVVGTILIGDGAGTVPEPRAALLALLGATLLFACRWHGRSTRQYLGRGGVV